MVSFPNGKINLGLHVLGKRADGFHDLETVFYPVPLYDVVEMIPAEKLCFTSSGTAVDGPDDSNLCLKAYHLLKKDYPLLTSVAIHLYKNIPIGAGLGGGSADAVACLRLLDRLGKLHLSVEQISTYALQLGSDCPFFLINKPCIANGRGEKLSEVNINLSDYGIIIVNPGIHINTGWAFSTLGSYSPAPDLRSIVNLPLEQWKELLHNDFEKVVFEKYPEIKSLKESLYNNGALYASLSGSGSTVYGIFKKINQPNIQLPSSYYVKWL